MTSPGRARFSCALIATLLLVNPAAAADPPAQPSECTTKGVATFNLPDSANPDVLDGPVYDLVWAGDSVLLLTELGGGGSLYRWDVSSPQFEKQSAKLESAIRAADSSAAPSGSTDMAQDLIINNVHVHETKPSHIMVRGQGKYYWSSEDGGGTFKAVKTPGSTLGAFHNLKFNPMQPDWVLAMVTRDDDCFSYFQDCTKDLYLTEDFGREWRNLTDAAKGDITSFVDFDWGLGDGSRTGSAVANVARMAGEARTILATVYMNGDGPESAGGPNSSQLHLVRSDNFFDHAKVKSEVQVFCANQFEVVGDLLFVARPSDCAVDLDGTPITPSGEDFNTFLYVSQPGADGSQLGRTYERLCLPQRLHDRSYALLNENGMTFLIVQHDQDPDVSMTESFVNNVFSAGPRNVRALFTLALPDVFSQSGNVVQSPDFHPVAGLDGTFIANQEVSRDRANPHDIHGDNRRYTTTSTVISLGGGGDWTPLTARADSSNYAYPSCARCTDNDDCYMFLHGASSWVSSFLVTPIPSIYSHESAPGMIMATGNVGPWGTGSSTDVDELCTFVSSDGGLGWYDVAPHPAIYEIGNDGGVILLAQHGSKGATDFLMVSSDAGYCYDIINLGRSIIVDNIRSDPAATGMRFIVHGTVPNDGGSFVDQGLAIMIDVSDLVVVPPTASTGAPGVQAVFRDGECTENDYDVWPHETNVNSCRLGAKMSWKRRKVEVPNQATAGRRCSNKAGFAEDALKRGETCSCQINSDFTCDYGYEMVRGDNGLDKCRLMDTVLPVCEAITDHKYAMSETGMRLVHNDVCTNPEDVLLDTDGRGTAKSNGGQPAVVPRQPSNAREEQAGGGRERAQSVHGHTSSGSSHWVWWTLLSVVLAGAGGYWWFNVAGEGTKASILSAVSALCNALLTCLAGVWVFIGDRINALRGGGSGGHTSYTSMEDAPAYDPL